MGTWTRLWVVLDRENRQGFVFDSRNGAIVEIQVRDFDAIGGERGRIDRKTMILACDFNFLRQSCRMVQTPMPKL